MTIEELIANSRHSGMRYVQGGEYHLTADEHSKILTLYNLYMQKKYGGVASVELEGTAWQNEN